MSIDLSYALEHKNDPAVLCCRAEAGTVINEHNLEDPNLFPDLIDTGLLNVDGCISIGQALGCTLTKTSDSLTALTPEITENIGTMAGDDEAEAEEEAPAEEAAPAVTAPAGTKIVAGGGVVRLYIAEGKDIAIEFPV